MGVPAPDALRLKGLETLIDVCVVDPRLGDQGWQFTGEFGTDLDTANGATHLHQIYTAAYPAVLAYLVRLLEIPAFAASVRPDHIKAGYYSIKALNPGGIVPAEPQLDYPPAALRLV